MESSIIYPQTIKFVKISPVQQTGAYSTPSINNNNQSREHEHDTETSTLKTENIAREVENVFNKIANTYQEQEGGRDLPPGLKKYNEVLYHIANKMGIKSKAPKMLAEPRKVLNKLKEEVIKATPSLKEDTIKVLEAVLQKYNNSH